MRRRTTFKVETTSARDQVFAQLMDLILDGSYPAGMRLDLSRLAESMGVSKTPVNEALQGLVREGLVSVKPRSGTFVSDIDLPTAVENFGFRLAMEIGAAEAILDRSTQKTIDELERLNNRLQSKISPNARQTSLRRAVRDDFEFHKALISASGNSVITEKYCRANALLVVMRLQRFYEIDDYIQTGDEHERIIQSIRDRNLKRFRDACKAHIKCGMDRLQRYGKDLIGTGQA